MELLIAVFYYCAGLLLLTLSVGVIRYYWRKVMNQKKGTVYGMVIDSNGRIRPTERDVY